MHEKLSFYLHCFTHLRRDTKNGGAPYKPILLLSVIKLFEDGVLTTSKIEIIPELVAVFKNNWTKLVETNHHPILALPFYHMKSEPFWDLMPNFGCEKWIKSKGSMRSFGNLVTAVKCASIDKELANFLLILENRDVLKIALLETYFPQMESKYSSNGDDLFYKNDQIIDKESLYKGEQQLYATALLQA